MTNANPRITPVEQLQVIGYADAFDATTVPRRVAPIFAFRANAQHCLFPPFRIAGPYVCGGTVAPATDFQQMLAEHRATKLQTPLAAQPSGLLWVNDRLAVHYGPYDVENKSLRARADERIEDAKANLKKQALDAALRDVRWASAANEDSLHAIALEAVILRGIAESQGWTDERVENSIAVLKDQAWLVPDGSRFLDEVNHLVREFAESQSKEIPTLPQPAKLERIQEKLKDLDSRMLRLESTTDQLKTGLDDMGNLNAGIEQEYTSWF